LAMKRKTCKGAREREQLDNRWRDMDTEAENWIWRELFAHRAVHIITDDQLYRDYLMKVFHRERKEGKVSFGPNASKELHRIRRRADGSSGKEIFQRPTTISEAVMDFLVLSKVARVAWTPHSTVKHFVKYLRNRYHTQDVVNLASDELYSSECVLGDEPAHTLTRRFQQDLQKLTASAEALLINPEDFQLPPLLARVLNFLADHHLEEIYNTLFNYLYNDGESFWKLGSEVGNMLYDTCIVAKLNRRRWAKACEKCPDTDRFHWLKALVKYRLRNYSIRTSKEWYVDMDDTKAAFVFLSRVPGTSVQLIESGDENDEHVDEPPWKRARRGMGTRY